MHGTKSTTLVVDLAEPAASRTLFEATSQIQIDILVNIAGYALKSTFTRVNWKDLLDQLQVMLTSLTELCHLFGSR